MLAPFRWSSNAAFFPPLSWAVLCICTLHMLLGCIASPVLSYSHFCSLQKCWSHESSPWTKHATCWDWIHQHFPIILSLSILKIELPAHFNQVTDSAGHFSLCCIQHIRYIQHYAPFKWMVLFKRLSEFLLYLAPLISSDKYFLMQRKSPIPVSCN